MVYLPYALERKYSNANKEWGWQYVFLQQEYQQILAPVLDIDIIFMRQFCKKW